MPGESYARKTACSPAKQPCGHRPAHEGQHRFQPQVDCLNLCWSPALISIVLQMYLATEMQNNPIMHNSGWHLKRASGAFTRISWSSLSSPRWMCFQVVYILESRGSEKIRQLYHLNLYQVGPEVAPPKDTSALGQNPTYPCVSDREEFYPLRRLSLLGDARFSVAGSKLLFFFFFFLTTKPHSVNWDGSFNSLARDPVWFWKI